MKTVTGVIHGKTIQLNDAPNFADGAEVEIVIRPSRTKRQPGEGFLRTEGALADDTAWDGIMEEIQQARHLERQSQSDVP
jgi:hypothetical protein